MKMLWENTYDKCPQVEAQHWSLSMWGTWRTRWWWKLGIGLCSGSLWKIQWQFTHVRASLYFLSWLANNIHLRMNAANEGRKIGQVGITYASWCMVEPRWCIWPGRVQRWCQWRSYFLSSCPLGCNRRRGGKFRWLRQYRTQKRRSEGLQQNNILDMKAQRKSIKTNSPNIQHLL
jgi:hypothetical protein